MENKKMTTSDFSLIETILWENNSFFLLDLHLDRLRKSADHFGFDCPATKITDELTSSVSGLDASKKYRIRLLLEKNGRILISMAPLANPPSSPVRIVLSDKKIDKEDIFIYHKTTNRKFFDKEREKYLHRNIFDVIFVNRDNEITEGAISNIVVQKGSEYFTPPISSGLLTGVYRRHLLTSKELPLKEKALYLEDLKDSDNIFIVNSVRKRLLASLVK